MAASPYQQLDVERGSADDGGGFASADCFNIPPTNASIDRLKKWRQAVHVLNASRRFRYTLDLKKEQENEQIRSRIRTHAQVIRVALLFQEAGQRVTSGTSVPARALPSGGFGIGEEQLTKLTRDHDFSSLQEYGGVQGLADLPKTNLEKGIRDNDAEIVHRRNVFGANTYPQKKGRSFWVFLWEASQDLTLIILMVAAVLSLVLGIKTEGIKEGWYDGGSIAFAVMLIIVVTASSDYRQSLQFQNLNEEKPNIQLEVSRGGRRIKVSIDESSMTGDSEIVQKDQKSPFLMSGCKVADGYGNLLVTAVGINTEWGLLMASISEDTGEETPLQVRLNGVATFIGIVGLTVAAAVLVVLLARYFTGHTKNPDGSVQFIKGQTDTKTAINGAIKILTVAVTIVVALPEGLPLAVTLTLAYSMRKMMADKDMVNLHLSFD